jgi:hypothetical protein
MEDGWGVRRASLIVYVRQDWGIKVVPGTERTISRLIKAMCRIVVGCVYFDGMPEFLKANSGIDDQTFRTAYNRIRMATYALDD